MMPDTEIKKLFEAAQRKGGTLDLRFERLDKAQIKEIAERLVNAPWLKKLDLSDSNIEFDSIRLFIESFIVKTSIGLARNGLGSEGVKALAKVLKENQTIISIDISGNNIGSEGAKALANILKENQTLTSIELRNNNIGHEGIKAIAEALKANQTITSIDLSWNHMDLEDIKTLAEALKVNKTVTSINLENIRLGVEGVKVLAEVLKVNKTITSINLQKNALEGLLNGKSLDNPEGVKALAEALKINQTLTSIDLSANSLELESVKAIAGALRENQTLVSMGFSSCVYKSEESEKVLVEALKDNYTLTSFELGWRDLDEKIEAEIKMLIASARDRAIPVLRKKITELFADAPLPTATPSRNADTKESKEVSEAARAFISVGENKEGKEGSEINLLEAYQDILERCNRLEKQPGFSKSLIQEFRDEAALALYSWDSYETFDVREKELWKVVRNEGQTLPIKEKAFSLLANNLYDEGMKKITDFYAKNPDAKILPDPILHLLLRAYTCGLHGKQDETTLSIVADALNTWSGMELDPSKNHIQLATKLFKDNPKQFQALQTGYKNYCEIFKLKPLSFLQDIAKEQELAKETAPLVFRAGTTSEADIRGLEPDELDENKDKASKPSETEAETPSSKDKPKPRTRFD